VSTSYSGGANYHALLKNERAVDPVAGVARVALAHRTPPQECPTYFTALNGALEREPPPFGTEAYAQLYRDASADGQWLAISLMTNAEREGDGATRLWSLAACCPEPDERQLLKRHAVDESHHAVAYLALLDRCFPDAVEPEFHEQLRGLSPHYAMSHDLVAVEGSPYAHEPSIDDYVQMNIAEIRTTIHHTMQREALALHCPPDNAAGITKILDSILRDELNHVGYTAELIERKAAGMDPDVFQSLFTKRLQDFSRITREELGALVFD
jgi:hypothetical protein